MDLDDFFAMLLPWAMVTAMACVITGVIVANNKVESFHQEVVARGYGRYVATDSGCVKFEWINYEETK